MNEQTTITMSRRDELLCLISDDYKSLYGFRPRGFNLNLTDDQLQTWHDEICEDLKREMEYERAEELAHTQAVTEAMTPKNWTIGELVSL